MNPALTHLRDLQIDVLNQTLNDKEIEKELGEAAQRISDLEVFISCISHRSEHYIFELAIKELSQSFLSVLNSHYRQSFAGQRLALEMWFAGIQFSTNELSFKKWKMNEKDIVWSNLINPDDGVLSTGLARIYWADTEDRVSSYRNIAEKIYRECSQYVHGNNETHISLPKKFGYSRKNLQDWKENLDTLTLLLSYTFLIRFNEELTISDYEKISNPITDILGHIKEARDLLTRGER